MPDAAHSNARPLIAAQFFPVTHSLLSADALGRHVQAAYAIGEVRREAFFDRELRFMREWAAEHHLLS